MRLCWNLIRRGASLLFITELPSSNTPSRGAHLNLRESISDWHVRSLLNFGFPSPVHLIVFYLRHFFLFVLRQMLHESNILIAPFHAKFPSVVFVACQNNLPERSKASMHKTNTFFWPPKDTDTSSTFVTTPGLIVTVPPVRCLLCPLSSAPPAQPTTTQPPHRHVEGSAKHQLQKEEAETRQFAGGCKHGARMLFSVNQERLCISSQVKIDLPPRQNAEIENVRWEIKMPLRNYPAQFFAKQEVKSGVGVPSKRSEPQCISKIKICLPAAKRPQNLDHHILWISRVAHGQEHRVSWLMLHACKDKHKHRGMSKLLLPTR